VVREHLAQVLQAEGLHGDEAALRLLGRAARGSMRDALSLTDQAIAYGGGRLDEAVVRAMLGSVDRSHAAGVVAALAARDGRAVLDAVDALRGRGLSAAGTLEEVATLLQQMAVAQAVPDALEATDPDHEDALRLAPVLQPDETQLLYSMALHGRAELGLMSDEYAALTMVLLRFLAFPSAGGAAAVAPAPRVAAPPPVARAAAPAPVVAPPPPPVQPQAAAPARSASPPAEPDIPPWVDDGPPPDFDNEPRTAPLRAPAPPAMTVPAPRPAAVPAAAPAPLTAPQTTPQGDRWAQLVQPLADQGRITALVRELAWQAGVQDLQDDGTVCTWTLQVERESLRNDSLRDKLAAALTAQVGQPQQLLLQPGVPADSVARREAWERLRRQAEAEQLIRDDPAVQDLLAQFKTARIVPGTVKPL
jgi:DNA polymerase-3 subunit gamma/tau